MNNSPRVAVVRASSSSRLMMCSGPAWLKSSIPEEQDPAGPEGTAAGELFEILAKGLKPDKLSASNGIFFDDEMYSQADKILSRGIIPQWAYHQVQVYWYVRSGTRMQGTLDVCWEFTDEHGLTLVVGDYKYGYGIVEVKKHNDISGIEYNTQLLNYIIGYINLRGVRFDRIIMQIYQPRPPHEDGIIRTEIITFDQLLHLKELIERRLDVLNAGDRTLVSGPHCRYCPFLGANCPADARAFNQSVDYILYNAKQTDLTPEDISVRLDTIKRIESLVEQHKDQLTIYARSLIAQGINIPGWKMINSNSKRTWKSEVIPDSLRILTGVEPYERKLKSPKQLEDEGVDKKIIAQLSHSPPSGVYLKKVDDIKAGKKMFGIS